MNRRAAFTLVELLVVIGIISSLAAILFPVFASVRRAARKTNCISNLRQIGMAIRMYQQDNGELPPHLSTLNASYVRDPRIFVCPQDPQYGLYPSGNDRFEGSLYLPSGVSYDYIPMWTRAQQLGWWNAPPSFGPGKWNDLTPIADCQWHWASVYHYQQNNNDAGSKGWELILTYGGSVRMIRVEDPLETFTPDRYN